MYMNIVYECLNASAISFYVLLYAFGLYLYMHRRIRERKRNIVRRLSLTWKAGVRGRYGIRAVVDCTIVLFLRFYLW